MGGRDVRGAEAPGHRGSGASRRALLVGTGLLVVLAGLVGAFALGRNGTTIGTADPGSVAVLPLRDIGAAGQSTEADRMTEELATALARLPGLTVRSASRARDAVEQGLDVDRIGRRLGVAHVVDGGVQRGAARLRVTLRLVRTSDGVSVWAGTYDVDVTDPMAAAQQVAAAAGAEIVERVRALRGTTAPPR